MKMKDKGKDDSYDKKSSYPKRAIAIMILRICLGVLFIYVSLHKIYYAIQFKETIVSYEIIPYWMINIVAIVLPWLEFWIGIFLIIGIFVRSCTILQIGLLLLFILFIGTNIVRGLNFYCGCFPENNPIVGTNLQHIVFNALLVSMSIVLGILERRRFSHRFQKIFSKPKILHGMKIFIFIGIFILLSSLVSNIAYAEKTTILKTGDQFPNIHITGPLRMQDRKYLGLSVQEQYSLDTIRSEFILIEFFSIYCPVCQTHADKFNHLYTLIEKDASIKRNMKMIAIGTGNNMTEVEYFRKHFNITFPCIADPDFKIHKALKEPRTPFLVLVDKRSVPYKILSVLDFTKEPENIIQDIREEIRNIQTKIAIQKAFSSK